MGYGANDGKQRSDSLAPEVVKIAKDQLSARSSSDDVMDWDQGSHGSTMASPKMKTAAYRRPNGAVHSVLCCFYSGTKIRQSLANT